MASVWLLQTLYYPREPGQRTSTFNRVVMLTYGLIVIINVWSLLQGRETLYEFVSVLSLFKLYVSAAKYVPQAWGNYKHQSTSGWSIQMVMLDFSGGFLSLYVHLTILNSLDQYNAHILTFTLQRTAIYGCSPHLGLDRRH